MDITKVVHVKAKSEILQARGRVANYIKEITTVETMEEEILIEAEKKNSSRQFVSAHATLLGHSTGH